MTTHLTNARLIDPEAGTDAIGSLLIDKGVIKAINPATTPKGAEVIDCAGHCLAPGIVDIGVRVGEPGDRHKESFRSAGLAAAAGGVTTIVARPDTSPAIDNPEVLEFVTRRAAEASPVRIRHMAALTKGREGARDDGDRVPAGRGGAGLHRRRPRGARHQGPGPGADLCPQP